MSTSLKSYEIEDKATLWRFMDFTKFVALISSSKLFFSRADQFSDPFEGAKGVLNNKEIWNQYYYRFFKNALSNPPEGVAFTSDISKIEEDCHRLISELEIGSQHEMKHTFISCWHENIVESEAMWKLYTTNLSEGIAIQTTYSNLRDSFVDTKQLTIRRVQYIDYNKQFVGLNEAFWHKRRSFEHEKEVRVIYSNFRENYDHGVLIDVDLFKLLQQIHISPTATTWFKDLVEEILNKYGIAKDVLHSGMLDKPFH